MSVSRRHGARRAVAMTEEQLAEDCALPGGYRSGAYSAGWATILECLAGAIARLTSSPTSWTRGSRDRNLQGDEPVSNETEASMQRSRRLYEEIFGKGNYDVADELMAADIINHGPGSPAVLGAEGIKRQAALLRPAIPDFRITLNDQFGHEDRVVSRWACSGTHSGPLNMPTGPLEGTGNSISFDEIRIDRHANGRIVES